MARAVLWDLDGTLLVSGQSIRTAMAHVLAEQGLDMFSDSELQGLIGMPLRDILGRRTNDLELIETMTRRYRVVYNEFAWVFVAFYDGVLGVAEELHARGVVQGVVTTKGEGEATTLLHDLGVAHLFATVVGDNDVRPLKPAPEPILEACTRLGIRPDEAFMVGDTPHDMGAAKASGAHGVGVTWGHGVAQSLLEHGAEQLVDDAAQLRRALRPA